MYTLLRVQGDILEAINNACKSRYVQFSHTSCLVFLKISESDLWPSSRRLTLSPLHLIFDPDRESISSIAKDEFQVLLDLFRDVHHCRPGP